MRENKIELGDGMVIIHRVSKHLKNEYWAPEGNWKARENKIRLENLTEYGYSFELIKKIRNSP